MALIFFGEHFSETVCRRAGIALGVPALAAAAVTVGSPDGSVRVAALSVTIALVVSSGRFLYAVHVKRQAATNYVP
jgi:hypothetical protein